MNTPYQNFGPTYQNMIFSLDAVRGSVKVIEYCGSGLATSHWRSCQKPLHHWWRPWTVRCSDRLELNAPAVKHHPL